VSFYLFSSVIYANISDRYHSRMNVCAMGERPKGGFTAIYSDVRQYICSLWPDPPTIHTRSEHSTTKPHRRPP